MAVDASSLPLQRLLYWNSPNFSPRVFVPQVPLVPHVNPRVRVGKLQLRSRELSNRFIFFSTQHVTILIETCKRIFDFKNSFFIAIPFNLFTDQLIILFVILNLINIIDI